MNRTPVVEERRSPPDSGKDLSPPLYSTWDIAQGVWRRLLEDDGGDMPI